jgi:hypothetical protein
MADAFSPPSPPPAPAPAPSPDSAEDLADARLAPWTFSPWPAPRRDHASGGGSGRPNPLFTILPVSALAIGLVLLVAVAVILLAVTRRARPPKADGASGSCNGDSGKPGAPTSSCGSHVTSRCGGYAAAGKRHVTYLADEKTTPATKARAVVPYVLPAAPVSHWFFSHGFVFLSGHTYEACRHRVHIRRPAGVLGAAAEPRRAGVHVPRAGARDGLVQRVQRGGAGRLRRGLPRPARRRHHRRHQAAAAGPAAAGRARVPHRGKPSNSIVPRAPHAHRLQLVTLTSSMCTSTYVALRASRTLVPTSLTCCRSERAERPG